MVRALESLDGVGLARASCQEPLFAREVQAARVTGTMRQVYADDFRKQVLAAYIQIRQIARN